MIFVDTNIVLDVLQNDPVWSIDRLIDARTTGPVVLNIIVIAALSRDFPDIESLRRVIAPLEIMVEPIGDAAAFLAGHRFVAARRQRGDGPMQWPLPDFCIGTHALTLGAAVLTRDASIYRRYFPKLPLITPETHPHG